MKVFLKSLGVKAPSAPVSMPQAKQQTRYPSLTLSSDNLDGVEGLSVGDKITLVFKAEVISQQKGADWGKKDGMRVELELHKGAVQPKPEPKSSEEAYMQLVEESREKKS